MNAKRDTSWIPEDYKQYASLLTENVIILNESNAKVFDSIDIKKYKYIMDEIKNTDISDSDKKTLQNNISKIQDLMGKLKNMIDDDTEDFIDNKKPTVVAITMMIIGLLVCIIMFSIGALKNNELTIVISYILFVISIIGSIVISCKNATNIDKLYKKIDELDTLIPKLNNAKNRSTNTATKDKFEDLLAQLDALRVRSSKYSDSINALNSRSTVIIY